MAGLGTDPVAGTMNVPGAKSTARHQCAVAEVPVVAARVGIHLGRAAELAPNHHYRAVEKPSLGQVIDQRGGGSIELRQ